MTRNSVSLLVITRNEEKNLPACLESARDLAQEIVIVDDYSQDRTLEVARSFTGRIFQRELSDYAQQKQFGLEQCRSEWVLNLDADERLSTELQGEIQGLLKDGTVEANGFRIPFEVRFMGRPLRHGRPARERHLRLFRRILGRFQGRRVPEGGSLPLPIGDLKHPIQHTPYQNLREYLEKCNRYTGMAAQARYGAGERFSFWRHGILPWKFFQEYLLEGGILNGSRGFVWAGLSAYYHWMKYLKLKELQERKENV